MKKTTHSYIQGLKEQILFLENEKYELEEKIECSQLKIYHFLKTINIQTPSEWYMKIHCVWASVTEMLRK